MLQYDWKAIVENEEKMTFQPLFILPTVEITADDISVETNSGFDTSINLTSYLKNVFDIELKLEAN